MTKKQIIIQNIEKRANKTREEDKPVDCSKYVSAK
jgi:hypothetical protein